MASAVDEKPNPIARFGSQVDEQIAQATSRIRVHDLTLGVLTLAAMFAAYAAAMILLDQAFNVPELVRQVALGAFAAACGVVGYLLITRPLIKRINPLYAAARVEDTIEDAKNSVTGYVEVQEGSEVHVAVKAAMSARAAKAVGEADVNQAVDHRILVIAAGILVALLLALGVMFFVFRPTQFNSLAGRAFLPFSSSPIATRTQITLVKPDQPEPTLTTGQTITVAVVIGGRVPAREAPDRVRVLLRHNPLDPNFEEIPLAEGETRRDWEVKVPEYLVQNGFWYKVAAGDAETPEYRVTVRSLPLFTEFVANYEYPAYTRKPQDQASDPNVSGVRGTKVRLVARTNRQVKEGVMRFDAAGLKPVVGKPVADQPDSLVFQFTITEPTRYRLGMTTVENEQNADAPPYQVSVDSDQPPRVEIAKPEEPDSTAPANGQLAVDGTVGDDFGIDKVRLRMRFAGRDLAPVYYNGGKSLRREKDNSWPRDLSSSGGFKLSADLTKLSFADGTLYLPKETDVVEYWVEAIDNCTETKPVEGWGDRPQPGNVGSSKPVRKLTLTAPKTADAEKMQLEQNKQERRDEEKKHTEAQQQQLNNENREPPPPDANRKPQEQKPADDKDGMQDPKAESKEPKTGDATKDGKDGKSEPKDGKNADNAGAGSGTKKQDSTDPMMRDSATKGGAAPKEPTKSPADAKPTDPKAGATPPQPKASDGKKGKSTPDAKGDGAKGGDSTSDVKDAGMKPASTPPPPKPGGEKSTDAKSAGGSPMGGSPGGMGEEAPPPRSQDDMKLEEQIKRAEAELNKRKGEGGEAKPNPSLSPEERADSGQPKPAPMPGAEPEPKEGSKPQPKSGEENAAAQSRSEGKLQEPTNPDGEQKPGTPTSATALVS